MRIIGKYVCQVEININIDGNMHGLLPFDEIHEKFLGNEITDAMKDIVSNKFIERDDGTVTVTKMYGDVYKVEDEQDER